MMIYKLIVCEAGPTRATFASLLASENRAELMPVSHSEKWRNRAKEEYTTGIVY